MTEDERRTPEAGTSISRLAASSPPQRAGDKSTPTPSRRAPTRAASNPGRWWTVPAAVLVPIALLLAGGMGIGMCQSGAPSPGTDAQADVGAAGDASAATVELDATAMAVADASDEDLILARDAGREEVALPPVRTETTSPSASAGLPSANDADATTDDDDNDAGDVDAWDAARGLDATRLSKVELDAGPRDGELPKDASFDGSSPARGIDRGD